MFLRKQKVYDAPVVGDEYPDESDDRRDPAPFLPQTFEGTSIVGDKSFSEMNTKNYGASNSFLDDGRVRKDVDDDGGVSTDRGYESRRSNTDTSNPSVNNNNTCLSRLLSWCWASENPIG
jgi:hypothetical protein